MQVILYTNSAEKNRLNKSTYLEKVSEILGTFREETSILNPSIEIERENVDFNYLYIVELKRYYFVDSFTSIRNGFWRIDCSVDVLMSYANSIRNLSGFIDRNENEYDDSIQDDKIVVDVGYELELKEEENFIFKEGSMYLLTGFNLEKV